MSARLIYSSSNGDRWLLVREKGSGRPLVRHEPNLSSGGAASELGVEDFLARGGHGPEHAAVLALFKEDNVSSAPIEKQGGSPLITAPQIRAGRGLLGWSQEHLAHESQIDLSEIAKCEEGVFLSDALARIAQSLSLAGVVLISEGEVTTGGPGVRLGALGTSTGKPSGPPETEGNDNSQPQSDHRSSSIG